MTDTNTIRRLALKLRNNRQRLAALYLRWILPTGVNRSLEAELLGLTVRRVHEFRAYDAESDTMTDVQRRLTFDAWLEQQPQTGTGTGGIQTVINRSVAGRRRINKPVPTFSEVVVAVERAAGGAECDLLVGVLERYQSEGYIVDFATVERFLILLDSQWLEVEALATEWGYLAGVSTL
ncbi:hypothetical protein [Shewanella algae]|uniref:Uncharacterized protein n=1 Tax=Shewanella algae TaxID=38313 RepID=A0A379YLU7_9GAMM|nr:hypothetical protein [Shewanella algae]MBO2606937.1 hypothetical protein [Shewanella algae]PST67102.1 hypothetical protein AYI77_10140 [Shewanella algae]QTE85424.1 hypothetical protein JKK44_15215 [Shewanella algae]SUI46301.1 Uncharacterised protein [Shewanella algae]